MTTKKDTRHQLSLLRDQEAQIKKLSNANSLETLRLAEDKLFEDNLQIIQSVMDFHKIGFDENGQVDENDIPFEWQGLPVQEKMKKIRLAKAGWMTSAEIPHAVKMAHATVMGIIKSRAVEQSGEKTLNIESVYFPAPDAKPKEYDIIDVDD